MVVMQSNRVTLAKFEQPAASAAALRSFVVDLPHPAGLSCGCGHDALGSAPSMVEPEGGSG